MPKSMKNFRGAGQDHGTQVVKCGVNNCNHLIPSCHCGCSDDVWISAPSLQGGKGGSQLDDKAHVVSCVIQASYIAGKEVGCICCVGSWLYMLSGKMIVKTIFPIVPSRQTLPSCTPYLGTGID